MRLLTAVLALAGLAIAGSLTYVHYAELQPFCVGGGGACERVQSSPYAELAGVPVALLGRAVAAFVSLTGFGFSAWLTFVELSELEAVCQWCVASALVMTAPAAVSVARLLRDAERGALAA